jgi:Bacterial TSP3 repeat
MPRFAISALLLAGCVDWAQALRADPREADSDSDRLDDALELKLGTDPLSADTDGDSLLDGDEHLDLGTDPLSEDSDGDGYRDPDELTEGTDPTDPSSVIYQGGWPYYPNKDELEPGSEPLAFGERMQRFSLWDQYGDELDLYDLYRSGPVVVTVSPLYCPWVWELAQFLRGAPSSGGGALDYAELWPAGPAVVARGDVRWVIVVPENLKAMPPTQEDLVEVAEAVGTPQVPVLSDGALDFVSYTSPAYYPFTFLLDEGLVVEDPSASGNGGAAALGDTNPVLAHLSKLFPE